MLNLLNTLQGIQFIGFKQKCLSETCIWKKGRDHKSKALVVDDAVERKVVEVNR